MTTLSPGRWSSWRRLMRAPRRLRPTREGRWVLGITLATGFAAMNTGNNLLFFGWGLLLASVLLSGVLSEGTLRVIRARAALPEEARAGQRGALPIHLDNVGSRLPAFGLEVRASVTDVGGRAREALARYQLRIEPGASEEVRAHDLPTQRGVHRWTSVRVATRYPFGFFVKSRDFDLEPPIEVVVYPRRVDVGQLAERLWARIGQVPTRRAGAGDEFFSLRPFRDGDDPRRIHWRRSARSGRLVARETESESSRQVVLELILGDAHTPHGLVEEAIATAGSLAEDLLAQGNAVGLHGPGIAIGPQRGGRQRVALLTALAHCDRAAALPSSPASARVARVAVLAAGLSAPAGVAAVVEANFGPAASSASPEGASKLPRIFRRTTSSSRPDRAA